MFHTANVAEQSQVTTGYSILHAVLIILFTFLACSALVVRIWSRRIQCVPLNLSDYITILGLVCRKPQNTYVADTECEYLRSSLWPMLVSFSTVCRLWYCVTSALGWWKHPQLAAFPQHGSSTTPDRLSPGLLALRYRRLNFCRCERMVNRNNDSSNLLALLFGCSPLPRFVWPLYSFTCTYSLHAASALSVPASWSSTFSSWRQQSWQSFSSVDHYPTAGTWPSRAPRAAMSRHWRCTPQAWTCCRTSSSSSYPCRYYGPCRWHLTRSSAWPVFSELASRKIPAPFLTPSPFPRAISLITTEKDLLLTISPPTQYLRRHQLPRLRNLHHHRPYPRKPRSLRSRRAHHHGSAAGDHHCLSTNGAACR